MASDASLKEGCNRRCIDAPSFGFHQILLVCGETRLERWFRRKRSSCPSLVHDAFEPRQGAFFNRLQ
jgi:hypothetical protein